MLALNFTEQPIPFEIYGKQYTLEAQALRIVQAQAMKERK